MAGCQPPLSAASGEALGCKLLQSVREMKAGQRARETVVEPNEVAQARLNTGLSQAQFAEHSTCRSERYASGSKAAAHRREQPKQ
jgi:hypothetical protein